MSNMGLRTGGHSHHCRRIAFSGFTAYQISWSYDVKVGRLRSSRTVTRDTDEDGARRFCAKWGLDFPAAASQEEAQG